MSRFRPAVRIPSAGPTFVLTRGSSCATGGLRQAARVLRVAWRTVERRSFEANRYQPVTVPVLIERSSLFIVATAVGPLRRKGRLTLLGTRSVWRTCGAAPGA